MKNTPVSDDPLLLEHWALLRCRLFWAYDHPIPGLPKKWDYFPTPSAAWLIRQGSVTLEFPDGKEHYEAGAWVFPRLLQGTQEFSAGSHILSVRFIAEWPNGSHLFERSKTISMPGSEAPALTAAASRLVAYVRRHFPNYPGGKTYLHGNLMQYLRLQPVLYLWAAAYYETLSRRGAVSNTFAHLNEKTRLTIDFLNSCSMAVPLHEREIARHVGLSVSQLNKTFTKEIGMTPAAFWNNRKFAIAQSRLSGSSESIKAIAYSLGFSSPENFTHWFRSRSGLPPRVYRSKNNELV